METDPTDNARLASLNEEPMVRAGDSGRQYQEVVIEDDLLGQTEHVVYDGGGYAQPYDAE